MAKHANGELRRRRFLRGIVTMHPEARAMHDHCRWCPAEIQVNGRLLEKGRLPGEPALQQEIQAEDYRARIALPRRPLADSVLSVVLDGVVLETRTLDLGPLAVQAILKTIRDTEGMHENEAFVPDTQNGIPVFLSQDSKEGPRAFLEKRKPKFQMK